MSIKLTPRYQVLLILSVTLMIALVTVISWWSPSAARKNVLSESEIREKYIERIKDGTQDMRGSVILPPTRVSQVISQRSGYKLSNEVVKRMERMESQVSQGQIKLITVRQLNTALSQTILSRIATLTDKEIESVVESLQGFNTPDLPEENKRSRFYIRIRAHWLAFKATNDLVSQVKDIRSQAQSGQMDFKTVLDGFLDNEAVRRIVLFTEAMPDQFSKSKSYNTPLDFELRPSQAVLLAYSIISDDLFLDSIEQQKTLMKSVADEKAKRAGYFPDPSKYFAYGDNGFIHSSPTSTLLSRNSLNKFLNLLEVKS